MDILYPSSDVYEYGCRLYTARYQRGTVQNAQRESGAHQGFVVLNLNHVHHSSSRISCHTPLLSPNDDLIIAMARPDLHSRRQF